MLLYPVKTVADFLGCSERRVRALLSQGRIQGHKMPQGWRVCWPLNVTPGKRGPDLRGYPVRRIFAPLKPVRFKEQAKLVLVPKSTLDPAGNN